MVTHRTHESSYRLLSVAAVSHTDLHTVVYRPVAVQRPEMDEYSNRRINKHLFLSHGQ
jgi:hypothetical protein